MTAVCLVLACIALFVALVALSGMLALTKERRTAAQAPEPPAPGPATFGTAWDDPHDPYAALRPHPPQPQPAPGYDRVRRPGEHR